LDFDVGRDCLVTEQREGIVEHKEIRTRPKLRVNRTDSDLAGIVIGRRAVMVFPILETIPVEDEDLDVVATAALRLEPSGNVRTRR